ncbi:MAG: NAD(P)H-binding protein [Ignavibacteria bacterium]|nr:NAD(P)H-binding protein [Ignavibacteria bacterium]
MNNNIFITGGTGYIGSRIIPILLKNGFNVFALVRKQSLNRLPEGCKAVEGNALDEKTFQEYVGGCDTFIQLVGVSHPSPAKKEEFKKIDLASVTASVYAAKYAGVKHFIYLSVAQPAPMMKEYIEVRKCGEQLLAESKIPSSVIRPWYITGPGHYWPVVLTPIYKILELIPATSEQAINLGLVKLEEMLNTIIYAVKNPQSEGLKIYRTRDIRNGGIVK